MTAEGVQQVGNSVPNEKERSHGRVAWQTRRTYFAMGSLASSIGLDFNRRPILITLLLDKFECLTQGSIGSLDHSIQRAVHLKNEKDGRGD